MDSFFYCPECDGRVESNHSPDKCPHCGHKRPSDPFKASGWPHKEIKSAFDKTVAFLVALVLVAIVIALLATNTTSSDNPGGRGPEKFPYGAPVLETETAVL